MRGSVELAAKKTTAASAIAGRSAAARSPPSRRPVPPASSSARPAATQEIASWARLKTTAVDRAAADQVGGQRGGHLHHHDLRDAVGEQDREGEGRGEGLLAHLPVDLDREQLAEQDERGEDPELGLARADGAGAGDRRSDQHRDARGAYEPEVEREHGLRARHRGEPRRNDLRPGPGPNRSPLSPSGPSTAWNFLQLTGRAKRLEHNQ